MSDKGLYIGGGIAVSAALALAIYMRPLPEEAELAAPSTPAIAVAPEAAPAPDATPDPAESTPAETAAAATQTAPAAEPSDPAPEVAPAMMPPRITNLRIEPDGLSVIAGQTSPLAAVSLMLDGVEVETAVADSNGQFLAYPVFDFTDRPRLLTMVATLEGQQVAGLESIPIAPRAAQPEVASAAPPEVASAAPTAEAEAPAPPADVSVVDSQVAETAPESQTAEITQVAEEPPDPAADPAPIIAVSEEGVRVLQPVPAAPAPEVMSNVALDTISYDGSGDVVLTGRAANSGFLQVYVDNKPVSALAVAEAEDWRLSLPDVDTGVYTLRIDEVDAGGQVLSRIETPFLREDPALVEEAFEEAAADPGFTVAMRTVQPGNTLWAIAEERYGDGVLYVQVFAANADRIRNPDLIYPGQVFELPELGQ